MRSPSFRTSRSLLVCNFASHQARLAFGRTPWSGQPCQKHPSIWTAIRALVNTMSGRPGRSLVLTRNRNPRRCNSLRTAISGPVSAVFCRDMNVDTQGLEAAGRSRGLWWAGIALSMVRKTFAGDTRNVTFQRLKRQDPRPDTYIADCRPVFSTLQPLSPMCLRRRQCWRHRGGSVPQPKGDLGSCGRR